MKEKTNWTCEMYFKEDENLWRLVDYDDGGECETYDIDFMTKDAPEDMLVLVAKNTTNVEATEYTVYDSSHDGKGFWKRNTYDEHGNLK